MKLTEAQQKRMTKLADYHSMVFAGENGINGPGEPPQYDSKMCESYELGYLAAMEDCQVLVDALEGLTNAALAGLRPLPSQVEAGFNALKLWRGE